MAPRLSIVVPIYNVERYLVECLDSIAAQTFEDFEVVMVDDGSKDGSAALARAYAAKDSRFRLVQQVNKGLGAARNTGIRNLTEGTEFLCFVDSDDSMPPSAYELMINTLDETGSDFATGNVLRFRAVGYYPSGGHRKPFKETRLKTHITEIPALVTDRTAWNKVYRRSFFDEAGILYPEGILYEDAPVSVPHHYLARSVDVLSEPIYHWREREVGEMSITQMRTNPKGLTDRVKSVELVRRWLLGRSEPRFAKYLRSYDENTLVEEIPMFFRSVIDGDQDYRDAYQESVSRLLRAIGPEKIRKLRAPLRLKYFLTLQGRIDEFVEQLEFEAGSHGAAPARGLLRPYADYPFLRGGRKSVPADVLRLENSLVMRSRLYSSAWVDGKLELTGHAYPEHLGAENKHDMIKVLVLREAKGRRVLAVQTKAQYSPEATFGTTHDLYSCDWAGFSASVDPKRLKHRGRWKDGTWRVLVAGAGKGGVYKGRVSGGRSDTAAYLPAHWVEQDVRIVPWVKDTFVHLRVETVRARVTGLSAGNGEVEIAGAARSGPELAGARLRLTHVESDRSLLLPLELGVPVGLAQPFTANFGTAALTEVRQAWAALDPAAETRTRDTWDAALELADGAVLPLATDDRLPLVHIDLALAAQPGQPRRALYSKPSPTGNLQFADQVLQPVVEAITARGEDGFLLSGSFPLPGAHHYELVVRHEWLEEEHAYPVEISEGRFSTALPTVPTASFAGRVPLVLGTWDVFFRPAGAPVGEQWPRALVAPSCWSALPLDVDSRGKRITLERRRHDGLSLESHSALLPEEASAFRLRQLRLTDYPAAQRRPVRDAVVYHLASGGQYADAPRAIHEELVRRGADLEHLWGVEDLQTELPRTARALRMSSPEWYEALATAKYVVTSGHLPEFFTRRPGQVVLQTWLGTPLKQIGHDFEKIWFTDVNYLKDLDREVAQWNLLLSGNGFSTPVLRRAFGYQGEVLEVGSPRNDVLYAADREKTADQVRERLGLPEGKKVVLYAPTFREDRLRPDEGYQLDLRLDLDAARAALGDDQVLLVRSHHLVCGQIPGAGNGYIWDVGSYPDMADLLLIADVLVTDYSSAVFDFAGTGRPILFFTYDLEHYRDNLRGFSLDLEAEAPGPLLATSAELVAALGRVDEVAAEHAERYTAFREAYCGLDDGGAAARAVDGLLGHQA
ncbi:bifunctional glycosyltransferase family 2 protein/CDP-glycerol:glycerophosphate glycerophosphotransferase [Kitasatospora sp. NBC_00240]|uniref:bifunctional glycosyltransferase/CDP-glycerol:glycerophosphate glycerophosphotransferase n=1 Tax=Kitasatospora sp. NBC_00240 TaxID=2903567 RepID=UPI002259447C|nr:bifunctional glycosyltransferase family 2 protein/CDP-glycerol:glycerophosphate glycerophosphotransferase [Kitasatospora sp. NBC_00240]MCX5212487.1 bifunctional glycosyltransferase family 2 protein/CDP-glycerol:glycerophosphate glycerophosphotransferase [Kitasatospora sp. NBC_00240]